MGNKNSLTNDDNNFGMFEFLSDFKSYTMWYDIFQMLYSMDKMNCGKERQTSFFLVTDRLSAIHEFFAKFVAFAALYSEISPFW